MTALLIAGHGTRDAVGVAQFHTLCEQVQEVLPNVHVAGGYLELSAPPIADAVTELVGRGHRDIVCVPLVLVAAGHAKGDIPAALARERRRHRGLSFRYGRPLGNHAAVLSLLEQRLDEVLPVEQRNGAAVVLVGRGSTDPDANSDVAKAARLLFEGRGLGTVDAAFISLAGPDVRGGLERARRLGHERVVVLPYFLFDGVLPARVDAQARDYAIEHPGLDVRVAGVIGPEPALADLVAQRYAEAQAGQARANCDACIYRVALPGFEVKVGAPQTLHDHPHDPADPHHHHHHDRLAVRPV